MNIRELKALQSLPLSVKVKKSLLRIEEWIRYFGVDKVYQSFSGGKDSTVLSDLISQVEACIEAHTPIPRVFSDTGLEFPEIRNFALAHKNIVVIKPSMNHVETIKRYGYPVISKQISQNIYKLRNHNLTDKYKNYLLNGDERGKKGMIPKRWQFLVNADFQVGSGCCDIMKKRVFKAYEKESKRFAFFTGEIAEESSDRQRAYLTTGCNAFNRKGGPKSTPLGFWTENDILQYIKERNLAISPIYGSIEQVGEKEIGLTKVPIYKTTGLERTGCAFCIYGCHKEDKNNNRFIQMKKTHPHMYDYCMRGGQYENGLWVPHKGLGMAHVLDTLGINYKEDGQNI